MCSLEDNWLDSVDSLRTITSEQWAELKLPMGLVNAIKKRLAESGAPQVTAAPSRDVEMIDTTTTQKPPAPLKLHQQQPMEEVK